MEDLVVTEFSSHLEEVRRVDLLVLALELALVWDDELHSRTSLLAVVVEAVDTNVCQTNC